MSKNMKIGEFMKEKDLDKARDILNEIKTDAKKRAEEREKAKQKRG